MVETEGADGALRSFDVVAVAGVRPLQQYLLSPEPGRTQALDIAWDTERGVWYDLYPDQHLPAGDGMHWTGPYKSWEARCAECHATGYSRNYDARTQRYAAHMAEIGVGCESCHGPGEAHAAWAAAPDGDGAARWPGLTANGLTVDLGVSAEVEIEQCAGCHSRREAFFDGNPLPGTPYHDSYSLALLRDGLYAADGQIEAENYEFGSFLQAKMYAQRGSVQRLPRSALGGAARRGQRGLHPVPFAGGQRPLPDTEKGALRRPGAHVPPGRLGGGGVRELPHAAAGLHGRGRAARPWVQDTAAGSRGGDGGAGRLHRVATPTATRHGPRRRSRSVFPTARIAGRASPPPSRRRGGIRRRSRAS